MTDTYYAAWVTNTATSERGTSWCWSPPYQTPGEASAKLKEMADEGTLIIGFVIVRDRSGKQVVLRNRTVPTAARKAIERHQELLDMI
jgi:hypothetical protein